MNVGGLRLKKKKKILEIVLAASITQKIVGQVYIVNTSIVKS